MKYYILMTWIVFGSTMLQAQTNRPTRTAAPTTTPKRAAGTEQTPARQRPVKPVIQSLWYPPKVTPKNAKVPVAVVLTSAKTSKAATRQWVSQFWRHNIATMTLTLTAGQWKQLRVHQIFAEVARCPDAIPADPSRIILVCDADSAPLAMRTVQGRFNRLAGVVCNNFLPFQSTASGKGLWLPGPIVNKSTDKSRPEKNGWKVPLWVIVGTESKLGVSPLTFWRKIAAWAPKYASITIDTHLGAGDGNLPPGEGFTPWLNSLIAGRTPTQRVDSQTRREQTRHATWSAKVRMASQGRSANVQTEAHTKTDGAFVINTVFPAAWMRRKQDETPSVAPTSAIALHYAEIYGCPQKPQPGRAYYARVRAVKWTSTAVALREAFRKDLALKGMHAVPLTEWTDGQWAMGVYSVLKHEQGKWTRWLTCLAAGPGSRVNRVAPLLVVADVDGRTPAIAVAQVIKLLKQSTKVKYHGRQ